MNFLPTELPGCYLIRPKVTADERGRFVKTFVASEFSARGLRSDFVEEYFSDSGPRVLRGMHFQLPPHDHAKIIYCTAGKVLDVLVDLRAGSPAYQHCASFELDGDGCEMLYIPPGVAHGFFVTGASATMMYKVTSEYTPSHDSGIRWDSVGFRWPDASPILSERDTSFVLLKNFVSPFRFQPGGGGG